VEASDVPDFLDEKRREISDRLKELRPLVEEYHRLEAAAAALDGVSPSSGSSGARRGRARTTTRRSSNGAGTGRRGRPRGSGTRSKEALALVQANPGITIPELADRMGIKQNYLYRVLPGLQKDGLVRKEGRGWHPKAAA
jgi:sugar-specific transcriptional regulator TrmB